MNSIAFLGSGRMATAMVTGLLQKTDIPPQRIACLGADDGSAEKLARNTGIRQADCPESLCKDADVVVLAIKPQQFAQLPETFASLTADKLILSILAGMTIKRLRAKLTRAATIVRAMPNTPGSIGAGITAYATENPLPTPQETLVENLLGAMGPTIPLPEDQLDAVTGLSGSGPAYVFELIAGMRDGGVDAGLARPVAARLALETVLGAALLLKQSGLEPETLRDQVTSPGGTTLAGLNVLSDNDFRRILKDTILAAQNRSRELSR